MNVMIRNIRRCIRIKTLTVRLDDDLHQEFKIYSVKTNENMQNIIIRLIKSELSKAEEEKK